jgi:hypothetical protein
MDETVGFDRYIGVDYSGASTPTTSLKGLRIYMADRESLPQEIPPPPTQRRYWTRRGVAEWLATCLLEDRRTLMGIDHGFSFPLEYFRTNEWTDWTAFLEDFNHHWPSDESNTYVDFIRRGICGNAAARSGRPEWRRLTEVRARTAKSVFRFDVPGSVAASTHAGLPWLLYILHRAKGSAHFWPFDGWRISASRSVVAEVYPSLWNRGFAREDRDSHQHDAYSITAWLRESDLCGSLARAFAPCLTTEQRRTAEIGSALIVR